MKRKSDSPRKPRSQRLLRPRIFRGHLITPAQLKQLRRELLTFKHRKISDEMRELIEEVWPELVHRLPPKTPHS